MSEECFYEETGQEPLEDAIDFDLKAGEALRDRYAARRHIERYWEMKTLRRYLEDFDAL